MTRVHFLILLALFSTSLYSQVPSSITNGYSTYLIKPNDNIEAKTKGNLFIKVEANKRSCYMGEPILVTYKLCTRLKSLSTLVKNPSFNGFSVVDMPTPEIGKYDMERINGLFYNVFMLRKVQLYPLQSGVLTVEPAAIDNTIQFVKESFLLAQPAFAQNPNLYFTNMLERVDAGTAPSEALVTHKTTVLSEPLNITVKDYPAAGKPEKFAGATGRFNVTAALAQQQFTTDDVGRLTLGITGEGNMMLVTAPDIQWPKGLEAFEPAVVDRVSHTTMPISGSKFFEYRFTVAQPGRYTIPPISFSWFDVQKGGYQTASTAPITFDIQQGSGKKAIDTVTTQPEKEKFFNRIFSNRWWVAGPVIGLILIGLIVWMRNEHKKDKKNEAAIAAEKEAEAAKPMPIEEPANPLAEAAELLNQPQNSHAFYTQLNTDLKKYLSLKLQLPAFTKKALAEALDKQGVSHTTVIELMQVLEALEWQLYTPVADATQMEALYHRSMDMVETIKYAIKG